MATTKKKNRKPISSRARKRRLALRRKNGLAFQTLERRQLLAAITVSNSTDVLSPTADTSSIVSLITNDGGDGISLREAIAAANNTTGKDTVTFDANVFTGGAASTILLTQGELEVRDSLTIDGGGEITIDAQRNSRVMHFIPTTGDLILNGLTITGGQTESEGDGGGIQFASNGVLKLTASAITGNATGDGLYSDFFPEDGGDGGGIHAGRGSVMLTDSIVTGNSTGDGGWVTNYIYGADGGDGGDGGGIFASRVTLINSTVSDNDTGEGGMIFGPYFGPAGDFGADGEGAGIFTNSDAVTLANSTVSGNSWGGGIVTRSGSVTLTNSTISGNSGNGIRTISGDVSLTNSTISSNSHGISIGNEFSSPSVVINNSIVAGNSPYSGATRDFSSFPGLLLTMNHSLIGIGDNLGTIVGNIGNLIGTQASPLDPQLRPLADNGGPTLTRALMPGSPAFDAGSNALALDEDGNPLTADQRGEARIVSGTVDMGAFEFIGLVVTTTQDVVDQFDDFTSLREAIAFATDPNAGSNTITFDASVFTGGDSSVVRLTQGELEIDGGLSIDASSAEDVVITGDADDDDITLTDSEITDVSASFGGTAGAVDDLLDDNSRVLNFSDPTGDLNLIGLTITGGRATGSSDGGGGIRFASSGVLTLTESSVSGNSALSGLAPGGGIYTDSGSVSLIDSTISGNSSIDGGGGISTRSGSVFLTNSTISDNNGVNGGGGIYTRSGSVSLFNSTISGNSNNSGGGGIYTYSGTISVVNSTISQNSSSSLDGGGGFHTLSGSVSLTNSTISGNIGGGGAVVDNLSSQSLTITNSIVAGNFQSNPANTPLDLVRGSIGTLSINYSVIGVGDNLGTIVGDTGNLIGTQASPFDPLIGPLADNGGPTLTHALLPGSPALDSGSNALALDENGAPLTTDQTGADRFLIDGVDIGAYEFGEEGSSLVVTTALDVTDPRDGFTSLREAIAFANDPVAGINNDGDADGDGSAEDTISFDASVFTSGDNSVIRLTQGQLEISESLSIDGSSVGGVVITGDANADDITIPGTDITDVVPSHGPFVGSPDGFLDDNSRVLSFTASSGDLTLTGLTITGGQISGSVSRGGGIRFDSVGMLTLSQSAVSGNSIRSRGGGIYTSGGDVSLISSTVSGNYGAGFGGGIHTFAGNVFLDNSTVNGNSGSSDGGGIYTDSGNVLLIDSTVSGNSTTFSQGTGGGIHTDSGDVSLYNSTVSGNSLSGSRFGSAKGGGIYTDSGTVSLIDSTVSDNSSGLRGGGVATVAGNISLTSSTVSDNDAGKGGGGIFTSSGAVTLTNSFVHGNRVTEQGGDGGGGGISTVSGNVSLVNSDVSSNSTLDFDRDGGGISTVSGSVLLTNSNVSGNSTLGNGGGIYTQSGTASLTNSTVSGNESRRNSGGGIAASNVVLTNSTVSGNSSLFDGGGIHAGSVFATNSTVSGNSSSSFGDGGGIWSDGGPVSLHNSIVAANTDSGGTAPDVGPVDDTNNLIVENSLIGDTTGSGITATTGTGNILNQSALLGPLADNGGPTLTHALLLGSPAIDAGNNALALDVDGNPLTTDQRGRSRVESDTVDIGAIEFGDPFVLGDADLSGGVDFADIPAFIDLLISGDYLDEADVNRDGIVDFSDIPAFIELLATGGPPEILLGDANLDGDVNFADIPPFINLLVSGTFLDEADIDRDGDVDFADIPPFIDVLMNVGSSALMFQSVVVAPPVSSTASLDSVSDPESIASVASIVEVPLTTETSDAIADPPELVEDDSLEPVEATAPAEIVAPPKNIPDQVAATESTSIEASQFSAAASLPSIVAPQFNSSTNNLPTAPGLTAAVEYRLPERELLSSSTPLSLEGGLAGSELREPKFDDIVNEVLNENLLSDEQYELGPMSWAHLEDPLP